jgi:hypothetical protein
VGTRRMRGDDTGTSPKTEGESNPWKVQSQPNDDRDATKAGPSSLLLQRPSLV